MQFSKLLSWNKFVRVHKVAPGIQSMNLLKMSALEVILFASKKMKNPVDLSERSDRFHCIRIVNHGNIT